MTKHPDDSTSPRTADVYDRLGEGAQTLTTQFQLMGGRERFHGPIRTIHCHLDNGLVRQAVQTPGEGAVLVVDGQGALETALMGGNVAEMARQNGWAGIVIHGAVRDRHELIAMDLGVMALGVTPRTSTKTGEGQTGVELLFGGARIRPNATIYCDGDGVLIDG